MTPLAAQAGSAPPVDDGVTVVETTVEDRAVATVPALSARHDRGTDDRAARSMLRALLAAPFEFEFDAAIAILRKAAPGRIAPGTIRFQAAVGLAFTSSDVVAVAGRDDGTFHVATGFMGLTGPSGALPRAYTEHVIAERRQRSSTLADLLDLLAQRPMTQFAAAGAKYRPHRALEEALLDRTREDGLRATLTALTGHVIPTVSRALGRGLDTVLHHAGAFATHPRSAERLAAILSDWFDRPVTVRQFAGRWIKLAADERTRMPRTGSGGCFHRLGVDAAAGTAVWDIQSTIIIRIGPLTLVDFEALLPGGEVLAELRMLTRSYLDDVIDFGINPVLAAAEVPPLELASGRGMGAGSRLGQNTWLTTGAPRHRDADETVIRGGA